MSVSRVTVSIHQTPGGSWVAQITGWRVEHTVAWTTVRDLQMKSPGSISELLAEAGASLVREFGELTWTPEGLRSIPRAPTSE